MDLASALTLRELGYGVQTRHLHDILGDRAEDSLLFSEFSHRAVQFLPQNAPIRTTFVVVSSPDGAFLASGHGDHSVYITSIKAAKVLHRLVGHPRTPWALAFHPVNPALLASGCLAGHVRVWDLQSACSQVLHTEGNTAVSSLCFHPQNRLLLVAIGRKLLFWDWKYPTPHAQCIVHFGQRIRSICLSPCGDRLYTAITNTVSDRHRVTMPPEIRRQSVQNVDRFSSRRGQLQHRLRQLMDQYRHLRRQYRRIVELEGDNDDNSNNNNNNSNNSYSSSNNGNENDNIVELELPETSTSALISLPVNYRQMREESEQFGGQNASHTSRIYMHPNRTVRANITTVLNNSQIVRTMVRLREGQNWMETVASPMLLSDSDSDQETNLRQFTINGENSIPDSCRIQEWNLMGDVLPDFNNESTNIMVSQCKVHNDGSLSMSSCGQFLACFAERVSSLQLEIISLRKADKAAVLLRKSICPNSIALSWSPTGKHILIGLAGPKNSTYLRLRHAKDDTVAQVFLIKDLNGPAKVHCLFVSDIVRNFDYVSENSRDYVQSILAHRNAGLNCLTWLNVPGSGFVYGTTQGQLVLVTKDQSRFFKYL